MENGIENEVLATITKSVGLSVGLGIIKHSKDYNVEVLNFKLINEQLADISVRGFMDNLKRINTKAQKHKPKATEIWNAAVDATIKDVAENVRMIPESDRIDEMNYMVDKSSITNRAPHLKLK